MIEIFHNVLTENHREQFYMHAINANYQLGWDDTATFEHRQYPCLHSEINLADWRGLDFIEGIQNEPMKKLVQNLTFKKAHFHRVFQQGFRSAIAHDAKRKLN